MVTRWGPDTGREDPVEGEGSILEGFGEGESGPVLVTLQVNEVAAICLLSLLGWCLLPSTM